MKQAYFYGLCIAMTAGIAGCGQKELPVKRTYQVQGKVTMKGEPVAFALITFEPKEGKGSPATAYTDKDGVFAGARSYSNSEMDGIAPGEYEVKIEPYSPVSSGEWFGPKPGEGEKATQIPPELAEKTHSVAIDANDNNQVTIDLN
jgi:hypothetical protein